MSTYTDVLTQIKSHNFNKVSFKPRMLWNTKSYVAIDSEFLNSFKTLVSNGVIRVVTNDALSDWNVSYELATPVEGVYKFGQIYQKEQAAIADNKKPFAFDFEDLTKTINEKKAEQKVADPLEFSPSIPPKTKEQVYKNEILKSLNVLANTIGDIYARVEKMETPNDFDLSKVSKQDLIDELMKRMS